MYKSILSSCFAAKNKTSPRYPRHFSRSVALYAVLRQKFPRTLFSRNEKRPLAGKNEGHRDARMNKPSHFSEIARVYIIATG